MPARWEVPRVSHPSDISRRRAPPTDVFPDDAQPPRAPTWPVEPLGAEPMESSAGSRARGLAAEPESFNPTARRVRCLRGDPPSPSPIAPTPPRRIPRLVRSRARGDQPPRVSSSSVDSADPPASPNPSPSPSTRPPDASDASAATLHRLIASPAFLPCRADAPDALPAGVTRPRGDGWRELRVEGTGGLDGATRPSRPTSSSPAHPR